MPIYRFGEFTPRIDPGAYIAPSAIVIGNVIIGPDCYIGHGAILRGDYGAIEVGSGTAIEEGVIVHARPGDKTTIGTRVTIGHGAMIHNATIREGATIGMRAVISDFADVGEGSLVGEQALVRRGQQIPPRVVAVGVPAKVVGEVEEKHQDMAFWAKELYKDLAHRYPDELHEISREDATPCDDGNPPTDDPGK